MEVFPELLLPMSVIILPEHMARIQEVVQIRFTQRADLPPHIQAQTYPTHGNTLIRWYVYVKRLALTFSLEHPDSTSVLTPTNAGHFKRKNRTLRLAGEAHHPRALTGFALCEHTLLTAGIFYADCIEKIFIERL